MARHNVAVYSDDDADNVEISPPPLTQKKVPKVARSASPSDAEEAEMEDEEDATTSMDEFIDDRALDELSEHSGSAEEGFTNHEADQHHKTPPLKRLDAPKYPLDTDDEGVEEAEDFQADIVESPKKRLIKREPTLEQSDDEEDAAMDISPVVKKKSNQRAPDNDAVLVEDSGSDDVTIVGYKKAPAKTKGSDVGSAKAAKKTTAATKSTPVKRAPKTKKKPISRETLSDTDDDAIAALQLSKDDKMYPETKSVKVQASNLKRGLPITPPLATRSSSKKQKTEPAELEDFEKTPSKKSGTLKRAVKSVDDEAAAEEDDNEVTHVRAAAKKTATCKTTTCKVADNNDEEAPVKVSTKRSAAPVVKEEEEEVKFTTEKTTGSKTIARKADGDEGKAPIKIASKNSARTKTTVVDDVDKRETRKKAPAKKTTARKSEEQDDSDEAAGHKTNTHKADEKDEEDKTPIKTPIKKTAVCKPSARKVNDEDDEDTPVQASTKKATARKSTVQTTDEDDIEEKTPVKITAKKTTGRKTQEPEEASPRKRVAIKTNSRNAKDGALPPADKDDVFGKPAHAGSSDEELPDLNKDTAFAEALAKSPKKQTLTATSDDVFDPKPEYGSITQRYASKIWKALPPPDSCEIYDVNLCNPYLSSVKSYVGMPKLRACIFKNTGAEYNGTETGCIFIGMWKGKLPTDTFEAIVDVIAFTFDGQFVNLSRIAPYRIYARAMSENRHETAIDGQTAIAVSVVCCRDSGLVIDLIPTFPTKGIRAVCVTNEGQRIPAALGELARRSILHTQFWNSAISFHTKTQQAGQSNKSTDLPSDFYNTYQSPKKARSVNASSLPNHVGALEYDERIPVYDAREVEPGFKFNASVFANPADYFGLFNFDEFPEYGGEIPPNSLCIIGYVTQFYRKFDNAGGRGKGKGKASEDVDPQELRVNTFIRWIFVVGVIN